MSQRQLAAELAGDGATSNSVENVRRQISSWVNDEHAPSPENAAKLAEHLGVSADYLTAGDGARRSLSVALEDLAELVDVLSRQAERYEGVARIVESVDLRLAQIEAVQSRLLEGQLTAAAALEEILERWNEVLGDRRDQGRRKH